MSFLIPTWLNISKEALIAAIAIVYIPNVPFHKNREEGEAASLLGEAYLQKHDYKNAEKFLQIALEKTPAWSRTFNLMGMLKEDQKNFDAALIFYLKAVKIAPAHPLAFMNIASLFANSSQPEKATPFYKKAFMLSTSHSAVLYYNYALFCYNNGKKEDAVKNYQKCLNIDPAYDMALNNLGRMYFSAGKYTKALKYFQKAVFINPLNPKRLINLAIVESALGNDQKALKLIEKALNLDPNLPKAIKIKQLLQKKK